MKNKLSFIRFDLKNEPCAYPWSFNLIGGQASVEVNSVVYRNSTFWSLFGNIFE